MDILRGLILYKILYTGFIITFTKACLQINARVYSRLGCATVTIFLKINLFTHNQLYLKDVIFHN